MKIGIIGLGLIGGSLYKSLEGHIVAVSKSQGGKFPNIYTDLKEVADCDVIFVCTPMSETLGVLDKLEGIVKPETVVADVCSAKAFVTKKLRPYNFVPTHPMAGTEQKGFENSFEGLFEGAKWVITPFEANDGIKIIENIIISLGAEPVYCSAKEHDAAVALISHAPVIFAQSMVRAIADNPLAQKLAASGFRDTTRIAMTSEELFSDMLRYNKENIESAVKKILLEVKNTSIDSSHKAIELRRSMY